MARIAVALAFCLLAGCVGLSTHRLADHLTATMLEQRDPEIVRTGIPAYLLLLDSLIEEDPQDDQLLMAGAKLYGAYATALVSEPGRRLALTDRALAYASRALCRDQGEICTARGGTYRDFTDALANAPDADLQRLFLFAVAWAEWIQVRSNDWQAVADLAKVELVLRKIVTADPGFERGRAQLYLGVLSSLVPSALGGHPEQGRDYFERAIRFSQGRDLAAKVAFARYYARTVFDQELHDRLLREVIAADPDYPGLTLSNVLAQRQAQELLAEDYF